jgi:hypothetical protein
MAVVSEAELVLLVESAIGGYVSARTINLDNVGHSMAESIVRALQDAGTIVIRDERRRNGHAAEAIDAMAHVRRSMLT